MPDSGQPKAKTSEATPHFVGQAREANLTIEPSQVMKLGDAQGAIAEAPHRLWGSVAIGGQDHFYLEGQVAMAAPKEDGDVHVWSSTQNPSEVQHIVAKALGI